MQPHQVSSRHRGTVQCGALGHLQEGYQRPETGSRQSLTHEHHCIWGHLISVRWHCIALGVVGRLQLQCGLQAGRSTRHLPIFGQECPSGNENSVISRQQSSQQTTDRWSPSVRGGGTRPVHNAGDHQDVFHSL